MYFRWKNYLQNGEKYLEENLKKYPDIFGDIFLVAKTSKLKVQIVSNFKLLCAIFALIPNCQS